MVTQALSMSVQMPRWFLPLASFPELPGPFPSRDAIEMAILRLSKLVGFPIPGGSPTTMTTSPSPTESEVSLRSSECSECLMRLQVLPVAFAPSKLDPVYIPHRDDILRPFFLRVANERLSRPVYASDIDSRTFRGFVRIMVADRPFYDPSGPPQWTAEYCAVYEVCRRIYVQKFTQEGHSMLYRMWIRDRGESAEMRIVVESVIGRPCLYQHRTIRIFEEAIPYNETGFSPLPPFRPLCARPSRVAHQLNCLCPR